LSLVDICLRAEI